MPRGTQSAQAEDAEGEQAPTVPEQALDLAQQLIDSGRPFAAHEVLEAMWKTCPADQRDLWRGLAQLAVGLTHLQRGNQTGAAALLRRGADRLGSYRSGRTAPADWPFGIDGAGLRGAALALADDITAARPAQAPAQTRVPRLTLRRIRARQPGQASGSDMSDLGPGTGGKSDPTSPNSHPAGESGKSDPASGSGNEVGLPGPAG